MHSLKRALTGATFVAMLALSLILSGGDADAKTKRAPAPAAPTPDHVEELLRALGVTWE